MRDIYREYTWLEMKEQVEKWQKISLQQDMPILTARQKNKVNVGRIDWQISPDGSVISKAFKMRWINKYNAYAKHQLADEGGDCCEEDEIDFFHDDADEDESENAIWPTGASPKKSGASRNPGGAPSPKHYRQKIKIKFTDDVDESPSGDPKDHQCEPGMTELGGWIICKHCGANLKKI